MAWATFLSTTDVRCYPIREESRFERNNPARVSKSSVAICFTSDGFDLTEKIISSMLGPTGVGRMFLLGELGDLPWEFNARYIGTLLSEEVRIEGRRYLDASLGEIFPFDRSTFESTVALVRDGRSLTTADGDSLMLAGIESPLMEPYAAYATKALAHLSEGQKIACDVLSRPPTSFFDTINDLDRGGEGPIVATCRSSGSDLALALLSGGWASPDEGERGLSVDKRAEYMEAYNSAWKNSLGQWQALSASSIVPYYKQLQFWQIFVAAIGALLTFLVLQLLGIF